MVENKADSSFLSARDVTKVYRVGDQTLSVLKGVSLDVERGELLSICGASGAGKSTLLHILGVLDLPTEGCVTFEGEAVSQLRDGRKARLRNQAFGFVFQFFHLLPDFSAIENVALPRMIDGRSQRTSTSRAKAEELLKRVGLGDRVSHRPDQLSGGERQRVAIARALANEPEVLFCDEPTGNLDSKTSAEILDVIFELNQQLGLTVIVVTHDDQIAEQTPRVMRLADGKIVADERR